MPDRLLLSRLAGDTNKLYFIHPLSQTERKHWGRGKAVCDLRKPASVWPRQRTPGGGGSQVHPLAVLLLHLSFPVLLDRSLPPPSHLQLLLICTWHGTHIIVNILEAHDKAQNLTMVVPSLLNPVNSLPFQSLQCCL